MVAVESRPFVFPREWPSVRNSLVAHERHSRTRVCRHEVSNRKGTGLGARDLCVCTGADRGCTCQRKFGSRTFDRAEDCGKGTVPVDVSEMRAAFSARTSTGTHLPWNQSRRSDTCARLLWVAGRADATGRAGSDVRSVLALHTACDGSRHAPTAAGHMRQGTTAGIRKRSTVSGGWQRAPSQKRWGAPSPSHPLGTLKAPSWDPPLRTL